MRSSIAAVLLLACFAAHAGESRGATRSENVVAQQCAAPTSLVGRIIALLFGADCGAAETTSGNIDTELPLDPR